MTGLLDTLRELEPAILTMAWRGGVWMLLVAALLACLCKASASARHWFAFCGMTGLLFVSVLGLMDARLTIVRSAPASAVVSEPDVIVAPLPDRISLPPQARQAVDLVNERPAAPVVSAGSVTLVPHPVADERSAKAPLPWLAIFWVSGVSMFGLRMLAGMIQLHRRRKSSSPAPAPITNAAMELYQQLSIRVPVAVLMAHRHAMPMTWGVLRPAVLLPPDAEEWPESRLRAVLLHELSHLRRADALTGTIAMFASACHWFNPVAWFVFHRMQSDRELACDDAVLAEGMLPSDYASHLLAISGGNPTSGVPTALASAMARTGGVEERIVTVLDAGISRHRMSAMTGWAVSIATLVTASVVGSLQLLIAAPQDQSPPGIDINGPMTFQTASHACVATVAENGTSGHLHLVDLKDNSLIWSIDTALPPHDRPLMSKGHVLLMTSDRTLHCYAIADGALLWSQETDQEAEYFLDVVQSDGQNHTRAILSTLGGTQIILDVETGESRAVSSFYDNWDSDRYSESSALSAPPQHWLPMVGEEVPPQFRDAYINERPTNYINDPQHLLAKEVRTRLAESLRNSSLIRNRDTQVLILDRNQEFPPGGIGQPGPFNILTDFGTRRVIAYFLGDLDRARSGSRSVRIPEAGNRSPSFELMTFLDLLDAPMEPRSKFADMANPNAVEGDPNFDDTDDWNVVAVGGRHVLPVAQFEPEFRQSRSPGPASDDWVVYKVDNTDTLHSLLVGGAYDFRSDVDGHVTATLTGAMGGELGGQTKPAVPVYSTTSYDRVAEILVKEGDEVWRDTPLIKLRGHTAAVKIRNAGVDLEAAETALDALEPDSDDRGRLQREVKRSRAALEKAASELVDLTLRSPAHGKVIKVDATVGEAPAYGTPVVVIQPE